MSKREISSTLRSLKFMQRASQKEETSKKAEELKPDGNFFCPNTVKKCLVVMEGDPHPGAIKGRMSFLSFNPTIDKLNEEAANARQPEVSATVSGSQSGKSSFRQTGSAMDVEGCSNGETNGDLKRKQSDLSCEPRYPNKSPKHFQGDHQSSQQKSKGPQKQLKHEKLDWNVLRPSKSQNKRV